MKKNFLLMVVLGMLTVQSIFGEEKTITLEQTVVSAESFGTSSRKIAKNIRIITKKEIEETGALTVEDSLKGVPGVIIRKLDGAPPIVDLRGSGMASSLTSTLLLLNGVPLSGIRSFDINSIPVSEIEKIEIIQGGGALMYGDGAAGGIVNIITQPLKNKKYYGNIGLEYGSWKTRRTNFRMGSQLGKGFSIQTSYSGYSSMDYRDRAYGTDFSGKNFDYRNSKDRSESIWVSGRKELENGNIELHYNHIKNKDYFTTYLEKEQYIENPKQMGITGSYIQDKTDIWNLSYNKRLKNNIDFLFNGGYHYGKNENQNFKIQEYFVTPQIKYTYGNKSYFIIGGDIRNGKREFKNTILLNGKNAPDDIRKSKAIYIMNKYSIGNWEFSQGYRREKVNYDYTSKVFGHVWNLLATNPVSSSSSNNNSLELGINYLYSNTGNIYFNYTNSMRTPSIVDMEAWTGDVKTKKEKIYEIGLRDYIYNTLLTSSVFLMDSQNEVYYDKTELFKVKTKNFDGKIRRVGTQLALIHYFDKLTLRENISFINPKIRSGEYKGKMFPTVPNLIVNMGATYHFTEQFNINTDLYYQSKAYADDDFNNNFEKENSYATLNINFSYKFNNGIELYGGVKNLFDKKYADGVAIMKSPFGPRSVYYPAEGRNIYAGFKYQF